MSYISPDFRTKKEFKEAVAAGEKFKTYNPSGMFEPRQNGEDVIEGPHYPKPHRWYARVIVRDGVIQKVIG